MRGRNPILIVLVLISSVACVTGIKSNKAGSVTTYSEDLSAYLPPEPADTTAEIATAGTAVAVDSTFFITARLDSALALVNSYNSNKTHYIEGLTIQLYSGSERSRAKEVQLKAFRHFPESKPQLIFDQPNYKVRMEKFYSQLEAYPVYRKVQSKFAKAILVPTRIPASNK
ncbi:MAG: hypothetical protein L3J06_02030 [Cyclobacteriaceae bacterium]|nr:hypothetical protein [Cyclobacteriaceae bacterium]